MVSFETIVSVCGGRGVTISPVPEGEALPQEAELTGSEIELLNDMDWGLGILEEYLEVGRQVEEGLRAPRSTDRRSLFERYNNFFRESYGEIAEATGLSHEQGEISIRPVLEAVIRRLDREHGDTQDIAALRRLLALAERVDGRFFGGLQRGEHPRAAAATREIGSLRFRSVQLSLVEMLRELNGQLEEPLNLDALSQSPISVRELGQLRNQVGDLLRLSCQEYAAMIPEAERHLVDFVAQGGVTYSIAYGEVGGNNTYLVESGPALETELAVGRQEGSRFSWLLGLLVESRLNNAFEHLRTQDDILAQFSILLGRGVSLGLRTDFVSRYSSTQEWEGFGAVGAGLSASGDWGGISVTGGGIFGSDSGGYALAGYFLNLSSFRLELGLDYFGGGSHQLGWSASAAWRHPAGRSMMRLGAELSGNQRVDDRQEFAIQAFLGFDLGEMRIVLQPIRGGGF